MVDLLGAHGAHRAFCRANDPTSDGLVDERRCLTRGLSGAVLAHSCRREAISAEKWRDAARQAAVRCGHDLAVA